MSNIKIPFNKPFLSGEELIFIQEAVKKGKLSGNGFFTQQCQGYLEERYHFKNCLLTHSGTGALEMAALLFDINPGDEIILPSFTFVSTANAFVLRGAKLVFADCVQDFPEMDPVHVKKLITIRTKAIVAVHYAGYSKNIQILRQIADEFSLYLIEDAAQAINSFINTKALGSIGDLAAFSFHETKNIQCGEGGALIINNPKFQSRAEILWEKGTDRASFLKGEKNKYTWIDIGSSFQLAELNAAFLWSQLKELDYIQAQRKEIWNGYHRLFKEGESGIFSSKYDQILLESLKNLGQENAPFIQPVNGNYHMFYLLFKSQENRKRYIESLLKKGVLTVFHYQSLHKSSFIKNYQPEQFELDLPNSDQFSNGLLRLPFYLNLPKDSMKIF